jgi:transposase
MRSFQHFQGAEFSYIRLEKRVEQAHPLRKMGAVRNALLVMINGEFEAVYTRRGYPLVRLEMLLKALPLQMLFYIRSEREPVEANNYTLLYRRFLCLSIEDKVYNHSKRLFKENLTRASFERFKLSAQWSDSGTLPGRSPEVAVKGK